MDIATDATFTSVTSISATVDPTTGRLKAMVDQLQPSTTYYWRARTVAGETSLTSTVSRFTVGPPVVIQAPQAAGPTGNVESRRPALVLANATRTGPAGTIRYRFEIATDPSFVAIVSTGTVDEGVGETRFTPSDDLEQGRTFYWRAQASDATTGVTSPVTSTATFRTLFAVVDGPYRLTIRLQDPACFNYPGQEFSFDGSLQMLGTRFKFVATSSAFHQDPITLDVTRTGEGLSGGVTGSSFALCPVCAFFLRVLNGPALVSGNVIGTSSLSGRLEGQLFNDYGTGNFGRTCSGTHTWTLGRQ